MFISIKRLVYLISVFFLISLVSFFNLSLTQALLLNESEKITKRCIEEILLSKCENISRTKDELITQLYSQVMVLNILR